MAIHYLREPNRGDPMQIPWRTLDFWVWPLIFALIVGAAAVLVQA
ncbi:hypothetical protein BIWAKO_00463 [Bosea sp. BIWAKO-01]|nr:hypothetical protein BIWAKO_00463 [Bosea sp. BIWAKO-01]